MSILSAIDPILASEEYALRARVGCRSWVLHVRWLSKFKQNLLLGYTTPSIDTLASLVLISNFELDARRIDSESTSLRDAGTKYRACQTRDGTPKKPLSWPPLSVFRTTASS
jgi:hypothetical protein